MKYLLLLLIFPIFAFSLTGCDDEEDVRHMDLDLLAGTWEVVESDYNNRGCIYEIKSSTDFTEGPYGWHYGTISTYYFSVSGNPIHDKDYNWSIREMENHQPLLDLTLTGELDNEDQWAGHYYYKIIKLTDTHMWWKGNSNGDNGIIKFRRRTDLER